MPTNPAVVRDYKYRQLSTSPYHKMTMDMIDAYLKHLSAAKKTIHDDEAFRKLYNRFMKFVLTADAKRKMLKTAGVEAFDYDGRRLARKVIRSGIRTSQVQLELADAEKIQRLIKKMTRNDSDPISLRVDLALQLLEHVIPDDLISHPQTLIHDFETLFSATRNWIPENRSTVSDELPEIHIEKNRVQETVLKKPANVLKAVNPDRRE